MAFQLSQEQFWNAVQLEEATNCEIGAGYTGVHLDKLFSDPLYFQQMKRLQSMVLTEFQRVLLEWNLGAGTQAAIACGQALLLERFKTLPVELQQELWDVSETPLETQGEVSSNAVIRHIIETQLTAEDWSAIATAAANAIQRQILHHLPLKSA
jgi:hypothetical protein